MTRIQWRGSLSHKALAILLVLTLVLDAVLFLIVGWRFWRQMKGDYESMAVSYGRVLSWNIGGEKALSYLETLEEDDRYREIAALLQVIRDSTGILSITICAPDSLGLTYIWDSNFEGSGYPLGYHRELSGPVDSDFQTRIGGVGISGYDMKRIQSVEHISWPVYDSARNVAILILLDIDLTSIYEVAVSYVIVVLLSLAAVTALYMAAVHAMMNRGIIRHIKALQSASRDMVERLEQNEPLRFEIHTGDEIEDLADSFAAMDTELRNYIRRVSAMSAEKERLGTELLLAARIQENMVPRRFPAFPDRREFDLFASMRPAKEVGGDFYDYFLIDRDTLALVIADVSGKGIAAALFMATAMTRIRTRAQMGGSPSQILYDVNNQLSENNSAELFVTVWLAILRLSTGDGLAANAGHEHPALRRSGEAYELVQYRHSPAVATMEGIRFREHAFHLNKGDSLFVYTDGVEDARNSENQRFGKDRLVQALNIEPGAAPERLLQNVSSQLDLYCGQAAQFDDITMLGFQYHGA